MRRAAGIQENHVAADIQENHQEAGIQENHDVSFEDDVFVPENT